MSRLPGKPHPALSRARRQPALPRELPTSSELRGECFRGAVGSITPVPAWQRLVDAMRDLGFAWTGEPRWDPNGRFVPVRRSSRLGPLTIEEAWQLLLQLGEPLPPRREEAREPPTPERPMIPDPIGTLDRETSSDKLAPVREPGIAWQVA